MINKVRKFISSLPRRFTVGLINVYQTLLSPDHSWLKGRFPHGYCRYYPSCSEYSKQAVIRFGFVKGLWLSIKRVVRCHPWAEPQVDPVPNL